MKKDLIKKEEHYWYIEDEYGNIIRKSVNYTSDFVSVKKVIKRLHPEAKEIRLQKETTILRLEKVEVK